MRNGIMREGRSECAIRPLPVSEQFTTRSCTDYVGLFLND